MKNNIAKKIRENITLTEINHTHTLSLIKFLVDKFLIR